MDGEFTTIEAIRAAGLEPESHFDWAVGQQCSRLFEDAYGRLPSKGSRKTGEGGSHCFAVYPPEFRQEVDEVIERLKVIHEAEASRQGRLFD